MAEIQRERELKFEVRPEFEIPDVAYLVPGAEIERSTLRLSSTYHDSPGLDLLAHGITLRRRTGAEDTGWQLKIPAEGARDELRLPLTTGTADTAVPPELAYLVAGVVRAAQLGPVATLNTERRLTRVRRDGAVVVEIADDRVVASTRGQPDEEWREVEIELGAGGDEQALAAFADRLTTSGATGSPHPSKLGRALGRSRQHPASSAAGELVGDHLRTAFRRLVAGDIAMRRGDDGAVHRTRVSVRRVRAVLRVFAEVLGDEGRTDNAARALDAELAWYQKLLGAVDGCTQLRTRLVDAVAGLPAPLVLGPVADDLDRTLRVEQDTAFDALTDALATNRYRRMLSTLATLTAGDPVAHGTSVSVLRRLADDAARTAATRLRRAVHTVPLDPDDLHRARKATVRARYAAEVVASTRKHPRRAVAALRRVQDVLGAHQDAVTACEALPRLGAAAGNGFTYGLLYQRELDTAARLRGKATTLGIPT